MFCTYNNSEYPSNIDLYEQLATTNLDLYPG